jgi:hypothetical protein
LGWLSVRDQLTALARDGAEAHEIREHLARPEVLVDLIPVADLRMAIAVGGVGEIEGI